MNSDKEKSRLSGRRSVSNVGFERSGFENRFGGGDYAGSHGFDGKVKAGNDAKKRMRRQAAGDIKRRHAKNQKEQRLFRTRMRALFILIAAVIAIILFLLLMPVFNIKSISISGNKAVTAEQVSGLIGDIKGTNIFLASKNRIKTQLGTINYIKDVTVNKNIIPPSVEIEVSEYIPAGYIQSGSGYLVVDENLYAVSDGSGEDLNLLPCISGVKLSRGEVGKTLEFENESTAEAVRTFLRVTAADGVNGNIVSADFSNLNNISFNYDNRLSVNCGTDIELEKKLRMFAATIADDSMGDDAVGTIDLSQTGRAEYTP